MKPNWGQVGGKFGAEIDHTEKSTGEIEDNQSIKTKIPNKKSKPAKKKSKTVKTKNKIGRPKLKLTGKSSLKEKAKINLAKPKNAENLRLSKSQDQKPEIVKIKKQETEKKQFPIGGR